MIIEIVIGTSVVAGAILLGGIFGRRWPEARRKKFLIEQAAWFGAYCVALTVACASVDSTEGGGVLSVMMVAEWFLVGRHFLEKREEWEFLILALLVTLVGDILAAGAWQILAKTGAPLLAVASAAMFIICLVTWWRQDFGRNKVEETGEKRLGTLKRRVIWITWGTVITIAVSIFAEASEMASPYGGVALVALIPSMIVVIEVAIMMSLLGSTAIREVAEKFQRRQRWGPGRGGCWRGMWRYWGF